MRHLICPTIHMEVYQNGFQNPRIFCTVVNLSPKHSALRYINKIQTGAITRKVQYLVVLSIKRFMKARFLYADTIKLHVFLNNNATIRFQHGAACDFSP
jgi:hypothetical protein